ncbi:hypothetical protein PMAYCL1PPCAC_25378 [Pristionchus mayeri]|uniref:Uncharacterized protein n=1 Tax=Pristionchus mayeri TaxID=1317129 RepID=A0AAN5I7E8_9BILA|nr:hypothetical protein PMAYCL1PPCAC_25378 [Pristionchus mayeri]
MIHTFISLSEMRILPVLFVVVPQFICIGEEEKREPEVRADKEIHGLTSLTPLPAKECQQYFTKECIDGKCTDQIEETTTEITCPKEQSIIVIGEKDWDIFEQVKRKDATTNWIFVSNGDEMPLKLVEFFLGKFKIGCSTQCSNSVGGCGRTKHGSTINHLYHIQ